MSKRTISILISDLQGGGAERVAVNLANHFVGRGYSVDMVVLSATGILLTELLPEVQVIDLKVSRIRGLLFPLTRYLRQKKPAALLACVWPLTIISILAGRLAGVSTRIVVSEHTTWSRSALVRRRFVGWQVRLSMRFLFPLADAIVQVSQGAAADLARFVRLDSRLISVIYNPVVGEVKPTLATQAMAPLEWWTGSHVKVLAVGTLKEIKDYKTLLASFAQLRQQVDAKLLILGEGKCRAALLMQAKQLGIESIVFMPGYVNEPSPYYQQADLFVLSSTGEGFGNVIVEALAAGTPVVCTDCPSGPREILSDGQFGRLVPVGDVSALADAMAKSLLATHDKAALMTRAQCFSIAKAADQYEVLLQPSSR